MIVIWIAAIVVFGIVEAVTVGLVSIWFEMCIRDRHGAGQAECLEPV